MHEQLRSFRAAAGLFLAAFVLLSCGKEATSESKDDGGQRLHSLGTMEVTARLVEIPEGAIFQRDLYDYATVLRYEVISSLRGGLEKGSTIYVGHYNPWKPRAEAADNRVKNIGGTLRRFRVGDLHHLALEASMEDHFMGGVINKYFGQYSGPILWAVWTNPAH